MKFSLSTNWCNRRIESGEEIADKAIELGFGELELGFHTTQFQVKGFKARLDQIPVGSVHAFCPVPISAPQGYPELYQLASLDDDARAIARVHVRKNIEFAAEMGADTVVLHAGRVMCRGLFRSWDMKRRVKRGRKLVEAFKKELEQMIPVLEKHKVTLGLENLPYLEGFPNDGELMQLITHFQQAPIRGWFDTGHARVCEMHGWGKANFVDQKVCAESIYAGMHLNDVEAFEDDHFAPGMGKVDFAALKTFAENVRHVVFEPNSGVNEEELKKGLAFIKGLWLP